MSDSDIPTSTRLSKSRSSTSRSRTGSSTSTLRSTASSDIETETFVLSNTPTATGLLTASVPVQTESTSSLAASTPTPTSNPSDSSGPNPPVAVIAVSTIIGVLVIGAVAFLLIFRRNRRRRGSPYITRHEPKRRDTHPQPTIHESSLHLASKESENEKDSASMSPSSSSLDCDTMRSPKSRFRSSRASSSIFIDDRDDVTISSRSNNFRPLSFGEPLSVRGSQTPQSVTTQPTPLFDRFNSNKVDPERQLPTIPGTPATPRFAFFTPEEQDGESLIEDAQPTPEVPLSRTTTRSSNRSSRSSRSKTRNSTPPTPTSSLPPLSPPPPIPLPPLPGSNDPSKRVSTNTLSAPSRPGLGDSRPVSMQSAYSIQSQNLSPSYSGALSPDVLATLERLKKRVSTPWSINSVDTYNFNRTTAAPTEEGHS